MLSCWPFLPTWEESFPELDECFNLHRSLTALLLWWFSAEGMLMPLRCCVNRGSIFFLLSEPSVSPVCTHRWRENMAFPHVNTVAEESCLGSPGQPLDLKVNDNWVMVCIWLLRRIKAAGNSFVSCSEALPYESGHCSLWRGKTPFVGLTFWAKLPGAEPIPLCPEPKVVGDWQVPLKTFSPGLRRWSLFSLCCNFFLCIVGQSRCLSEVR